MPGLADTTVRLLGQDPLAGRLPTADQLRVAEILDGAGFAYLEVSGGGCFDSAVQNSSVASSGTCGSITASAWGSSA